MEKIFFIIGLSMIFAGGVKASEIIGQISTDPNALSNYGSSATTTGQADEPNSPSQMPIVLGQDLGAAPAKGREVNAPKDKADEDKAAGGGIGKEVLGKKIYSSGSLLRNIDSRIYLIENRVKKHIFNLKELQKYRSRTIYNVKPEELAEYQTREHLDGDLIRQRGDVKVYFIKNEKKIHILNLEELRANFFGLEIFNITAEEIFLY